MSWIGETMSWISDLIHGEKKPVELVDHVARVKELEAENAKLRHDFGIYTAFFHVVKAGTESVKEALDRKREGEG